MRPPAPGWPVLRALGVLLVAVLLGACADAPAAGAGADGPAGPAARRPDFLGHDGRTITLDGRPAPLVGINVYNAASRGNCWYDMRAQLGGVLDRVALASHGRARVIRVWFFQSLATRDGRRDWTELDRVVATARAHGFRVVPVLTDQWGACEGANGTDGAYKDVGWYQRGYRDPAGSGGPASYRDWVREVVTRYRGEPTVALWSLVNEAEARARRSGPCPATAFPALDAFVTDMGALVKGADPDHLLGFGTIGTGQCGTADGLYARLHSSPAIDLCEYHDYDLADLPGDDRNGLRAQLAACAALDKPIVVGESGVLPAEVGGVDARAAVYRAKLAAQVPAGIAGLLMWGWSTTGYAPDDEYGIGPTDPSLRVLGDYPDVTRR